MSVFKKLLSGGGNPASRIHPSKFPESSQETENTQGNLLLTHKNMDHDLSNSIQNDSLSNKAKKQSNESTTGTYSSI